MGGNAGEGSGYGTTSVASNSTVKCSADRLGYRDSLWRCRWPQPRPSRPPLRRCSPRTS